MVVRNRAIDGIEELAETIGFISSTATARANRRDAAGASTPGVAPAGSGIAPAGRRIGTGRDLLRSQFPLGWFSR